MSSTGPVPSVKEKEKSDQEESAEQERHLWEITKNFKNAMLVTRDGEGNLVGRPMTVALHDKIHREMWFITREGETGTKINHDIETVDENVGICFQSDSTFVSISGKASVIRDKSLVTELLSECHQSIWVEGNDRKNETNNNHLTAIRVAILICEFWDHSGVTRRFRLLTEAGRAWIESRVVDSSKYTDHAKLVKTTATTTTTTMTLAP